METALNQKTYALFSTAANQKLAVKLEQNGAKIFRFAPVGVRAINTKENAEILRNDLLKFDWIVFPDVFAVDCFLQILEEIEIDAFELDAIHVFALGEAVSDRLRFVQIHADVIPHFIEKQAIISTLLNYLGEDKIKDMSFLIPKAAHFETEFKGELVELASSVTEIAVYELQDSEKDKTVNLKALLKGGAIDEFIFDSPEDLLSLKYYLGGEDLSEIFVDIKTSGTSETVIKALRENGLRPLFFPIK
jgi:uroporphyrinogen-III synthase